MRDRSIGTSLSGRRTLSKGLDNVAGVPKGSFALVTKIHHAAVDGVSGAEISAAIHDLEPESDVDGPERSWVPERLPTGVELLTRSAARSIRTPFKFGKLLYRSAPSLAKVAAGVTTRQLKVPVRVPRTRFNTNVSSHRVFDGRTFDLGDVKAMKNSQTGTTVNDVVVTVCGGALRKYLQAKNELPDDSLVAMAPMSARPADKQTAAGNLVTAMSLPIRSDIADPVERLIAVNQESTQAKKLTHTMGPHLAADAAEFLPSTMTSWLARTYAASGMVNRMPPLFNTVITNVPGVSMPLYSMGSRMVATFGLGPVVHGLGLFQPVLSYNNTITISAVADRDMMPDPAFYADCLQESFDELKSATLTKPKARSRNSTTTTDGKKSNKRSARKATKKKAGKDGSNGDARRGRSGSASPGQSSA